MFADLNVPVPTLSKQQLSQAASKKGKGKQDASANAPAAAFTPAQVAAIESRVDMLVHCQLCALLQCRKALLTAVW